MDRLFMCLKDYDHILKIKSSKEFAVFKDIMLVEDKHAYSTKKR